MGKILKSFILISTVTFVLNYAMVHADNGAASMEQIKSQIEAMEKIISAQQGQIEELKTLLVNQPANTESIASHRSAPVTKENIDEVVNEHIEEYFENEKNIDKIAKKAGPQLDMGYNNGFYLKSLDDTFSLKTTGMFQFRYTYDDRDEGHQDESSFKVHRGRLKFAGNAYNPDLKYMLQLETRSTGVKDGSKAVEMLDFFADYTKYEKFKFRVGQWKVPFNTQFLTSAGKLQFVNRSEADDTFNLGRQLGAMVYGELFDEKLEYFMGLWNGNFRNEKKNDNNEHLWIARVAFHPLDHYYGHPGKHEEQTGHTKHYGHYEDSEGDVDYSGEAALLIAGAIAFDSQDEFEGEFDDHGRVTADEVDITRVVGELGFKYKGFSFLSEYYWRKTTGLLSENLLDSGFFVQAGYFLIPKKLEVAGRYSLTNFDNEFEVNSIREMTLGVNYFLHSHRHKIQLNGIRKQEEVTDNEDETDYELALQYQMSF